METPIPCRVLAMRLEFLLLVNFSEPCDKGCMDVMQETCLNREQIARELGIHSGVLFRRAKENKNVEPIEKAIHIRGRKLKRILHAKHESLAEKIIVIREEVGIPFARIAKHLGISQQALSESIYKGSIPEYHEKSITRLLSVWASELCEFKASSRHRRRS